MRQYAFEDPKLAASWTRTLPVIVTWDASSSTLGNPSKVSLLVDSSCTKGVEVRKECEDVLQVTIPRPYEDPAKPGEKAFDIILFAK